MNDMNVTTARRNSHANARGDIKRHGLPMLGTIEQIDDGFGRIADDDGRFVYFHRNSVRDISFDKLSVGAVVEFEEEQGEQGTQAAAVKLWRDGVAKASRQQ